MLGIAHNLKMLLCHIRKLCSYTSIVEDPSATQKGKKPTYVGFRAEVNEGNCFNKNWELPSSAKRQETIVKIIERN